MRVALLALSLSMLSGCAILDAPCGCGERFDRDPFDPAGALTIDSSHAVSDHCRCYCDGVGPERLLPPSRTCERYEEMDCGDGARWVCPE